MFWAPVFGFVPISAMGLAMIMDGIRSQEMLEELRTFRLADAACFDEDDREALLALIGDWFTDHASGETDALRLRQVGWPRFENIVRNEATRPDTISLLRRCCTVSKVSKFDVDSERLTSCLLLEVQ